MSRFAALRAHAQFTADADSAPAVSFSPDRIRELIAAGIITRERSCDGKDRFSSYAKAERSRDKWKERDGQELHIYACYFCYGFHLAHSDLFALRHPEASEA